ncbi:MAG: M48 family metallopeptidase [Planctomycetes bacterium]|nr:M48 family metallopeptidase [Planctomycetota bacterium]
MLTLSIQFHRLASSLLFLVATLGLQSCGIMLLSAEEEIQMGLQAYPEETGKYTEIKSGPNYEIVQRVTRTLAQQANADVAQSFSEPFKWECKLLEAPKTVNAWCLPGGKMAIYTGILPICKNETGIAVVMSHEIGHAVLRHSNQRISTNMILKGAMDAGQALFGGSTETTGTLMSALGMGAQYGVLLPFSRSHESEADLYGVELMIRAGYDPWESVDLWKRMAALGSSGPEFLSTHPNPENRAQRLAEAIPGLLQKYGKKSSR